jgi:tetraacyldisaccharide 4'-kinase
MTRDPSSSRMRLLRRWEGGLSPTGSRLLAAASTGYRGLLGAREWLYARGVFESRELACPVVSVGNLTLGGTGKTPAVMRAVQTLIDLGHRPAVVSRGYRRRTRGALVVADTASIRLDAEDAGDEPFLLARRLPGVPVLVGASRRQTAELALRRFGVTAIVIDDGFQHRTLRKDLEIVMARAANPWGNGQLFPQGPLREPFTALARADLVVAAGVRRGVDAAQVATTVGRYAPGVPVLAAAYAPTECWEAARMEPVRIDDVAGARVVAFAGIGTPETFRRTLEDLGASVAAFVAFDDHHWYSARELTALDDRARAVGADALVTTEKDWVRLRRLPTPGERLWILSVRLELVSGELEWRAAFERACRKA